MPVALGCVFLIASGGLGLAQPLAAREVLETLALDQGLTGALIELSALVVAAAVLLGLGSFLVMRSAEAVVFDGRRT